MPARYLLVMAGMIGKAIVVGLAFPAELIEPEASAVRLHSALLPVGLTIQLVERIDQPRDDSLAMD